MTTFKSFFAFMFLLSLPFCNATQTAVFSLDIGNSKFIFDKSTQSWKNFFNASINASDLIEYLCSKTSGRFKITMDKPAEDCILKLKEILDQQGGDYIRKLKDNLLAYGNLGYFPNISFSPQSFQREIIVNKMIPRGIFKIKPEIANRVFQAQLDYLSPINNTGYNIDAKNAPHDLEGFVHSIIQYVFNSVNFSEFSLQKINEHTINLEFKYNDNNPERIVGWNKDGKSSKKIRLEIQILNGFVEIVTMYPI